MKDKCCHYLEKSISEGKSSLNYVSNTRTYSILDRRGQYRSATVINNCPFCGNKLPKSLNEEWYELMKKNQHPDGHWDMRKIPREFRTDEWWRKRKL